MCLALPMKVESVTDNLAQVKVQEISLTVCLDLVETVSAGDYILVHAGYAIEKLSPEEAAETLAIFERLGRY